MARGLCGLGAGMSCGKWGLWALLGLLAITMLMWLSKRVPIENDIQARTAEALSSQGYDWTQVDLERRGRDVLLHGAAPSNEARLNALDIAKKVYGVRIVEDSTTELKLGSASFGLSHQAEKVFLSGSIPKQNLIDSAVEAASKAYGAENIVNGMKLDEAVRSPSWLDDLNAMMPILAQLRDANVEISDDGISFAGLMETDDAKEELLSAASGLFDFGVTESIAIKPSGPSVEELAAIAAEKAKQAAAKLVAEKAEAEAAANKLAMEKAKAEESVKLAEEKAKIEEAARLAAERAKAEEVARLAAEKAKAEERAAFVANCQTQLNATMEGEAIHFASGSANITASSYPLLDRIADLMADCNEALRQIPAIIEVAGHTDSTGSHDLNENLSGLRANAVRDYLITNGTPADLLDANGYGETNPIADNATAEGRAQNRRIQFDIKQ